MCIRDSTITSRRWRAVMKEVDKGCSEFCVTVGTATRTAGILVHSWLKALAVNLSWPSGRLWLCVGLIGSNNPWWLKPDLVVYANHFSSSSWLWVDECFFWYRDFINNDCVMSHIDGLLGGSRPRLAAAVTQSLQHSRTRYFWTNRRHAAVN